jgi:pantoate--beta-alanine ligase
MATMEIVKDPVIMQAWSQARHRSGQKIGLVPTMGFLHQGHLSLVRKAREICDAVVVSIFVNPIQFGQGEDYEQYPRDLSRDTSLLRAEGVDVVFAPGVRDMYSGAPGTFVETLGMEDKLCGKSRPGHFKGVTTVVAKLFNICLPDVAVFGQKDAQQVMIIEKMVRDLNFPLEIVRGPIVREADGLALSSRNVYLTSSQRENATVLHRSLKLAEDLIAGGARDPVQVREAMVDYINRVPEARIDYVEIYSGKDLSEIDFIKGQVLIALAVKFGDTRLIDNLLLEV